MNDKWLSKAFPFTPCIKCGYPLDGKGQGKWHITREDAYICDKCDKEAK